MGDSSLPGYYWRVESTLDVQYIMAMAPGVATSFYVVDGYDCTLLLIRIAPEPTLGWMFRWIYDFTTLIQQRSSQKLPVPLIFSVSYGWAESDQVSEDSRTLCWHQLMGFASSVL